MESSNAESTAAVIVVAVPTDASASENSLTAKELSEALRFGLSERAAAAELDSCCEVATSFSADSRRGTLRVNGE